MSPPVRVAVAGCGHWGRNLVRNYAALGALAAVSDVDAGRAGALAAQHDVPARSYADVLADPVIDGVVIATTAVTHHALAMRALDAGKHVYVEKPMALEVATAEAMVARADAAGRVLMVGHLLQYHPAFQELRRLIDEGRLGKLLYLYSNRLNLGRVRTEESSLWSFAPHDISMILALVGAAPSRTWAVGASYLNADVADVTSTFLEFPRGQKAHIHVSWLHPTKEQRLVVIGDNGMAVFDDTRDWPEKLVLYPHGVDWKDGQPQPVRADAEPVALTPMEPLKEECRHFLDCVADAATPRTDGHEGLRVLRVLREAELAMRGGIAPVPAARPDVSVHPTACIDEPCEIGEGTRIWHFSHVLAGSQIGRNCVIGQNVMIGPDVTIGDGCKVQNNVSLYRGVTLEDDVFCGPSAVFTNVNTPRADIERKQEFQPTLVRRGATIGANATVVCGVELGERSFVAAGAVVVRDVAPHALVAGNPARRIAWVGHAGERLEPDGDTLRCPRSGRRYREAAPEVLEEITETAARAASGGAA